MPAWRADYRLQYQVTLMHRRRAVAS